MPASEKKMNGKPMNKNFDPKLFEREIYSRWCEKGYFTPKADPAKKPFTIVMPPPNVTGRLHMGHALDETYQDVIIRYKRMDGRSALWLPGTDHASIATELKIVEQISKEGLTKERIGREEFLRRAYAWKNEYGGTIVGQLKRLGCSCDWTREAFTMDEKRDKAVREAFVRLYKKGLIYRGNRMSSRCPGCGTALSDAEIEYEERESNLWHIKYPFSDGSGHITVATTRPETMLGDTAVAVNPGDVRYKDVAGKKVRLPLTDRIIPVIADDFVEKDFGTGAVKITPAHDPDDFEAGLRHNLETIAVIDHKGRMNENAGKYRGLTAEEARGKIVEALEKGGYIEKIEPYIHNVGVCYRCRSVVEPAVSEQWFLSMKELAKPAIEAVRSGAIKFIPARFAKVYLHWMENIKDWCISRQLWWGHRIPCFYCEDCGEQIVERNDPEVCPKCGGKRLKRDEDVLDTWFSSALWPFSTLGFPDKTEDFDYFYPTDVLVTAYDIIFFWVARMIFSGLEFTGKPPFGEVLIHGIVRDSAGRKMSKSAGNGVNPLDLIDKYGADALRYTLCTGVAPGGDIRFGEGKMEAGRNFMNKLWNAARYVIMNSDGAAVPKLSEVEPNDADKWILTKLQYLAAEVRRNLDGYEIGLALAKLYDFIWSDYCDWYIEFTKPALYGGGEAKRSALAVLEYTLAEVLKSIHPFVPFITEEIWSHLGISETITLEKYPVYDEKLVDAEAFEKFEEIEKIIVKIRNVRAEADLPPSKKISLKILTDEPEKISGATEYIERLAGVKEVEFIDEAPLSGEKTLTAVAGKAELFIPIGELVDFKKEKARVGGELNKCEAEIKRSENLLNNPGFVAKAPPALVEKERRKLGENTALKEKLLRRLAEFS